ncbi:MAG: NAD-dependent epimerase/dehydratase family protein [Candidatus Omnitrophica bacterium]|nr:NAD-dependent epimerase/dehydratase family protein [Candidatus Omnitrophota bacterium]
MAIDQEKVLKNSKVMITGGLGFIGSTLAHRLVQFGSEVLIVDSLLPDYGGNLFNVDGIKERVKINIADVRDGPGMDYLVKGQDFIFNLAGTLSHIDSMADPYTDLEINCRSQLTILEACRKNNPGVKIVFSGTRGQYGRAQYLPVDEKHPMCPTDVNGINNMAGEWYHILYNNVYGIRATSLRLTNTFGPRHQMKHAKQGFLNWFVRMAIEGKEVPIYGDGSQKRDFNYVDDVVDALILAAATDKTNGEVYNIGSGKPVSVLDTLKAIIGVTGSGSYRLIDFPDDKKKIEVGDYYADYSKFSGITGWRPKTDFMEGLRKTVRYYEKNREKYW